MKVLHVTSFDGLGGAGMTAFRLHRALRAAGVESRMLVRRSQTGDAGVEAVAAGLRGLPVRLRGWLGQRAVGLLGRPNRSLNLLPGGLHRRINASDADLVHLHWVHNEMISIGDIARIRKPLVWTLHDLWPLCGAEHLPETNFWRKDSAPDAARQTDWINRRVFDRKRRAWAGLDVALVAPSVWMAEQARASLLFSSRPVTVIPNGLDTGVFHPRDRAVSRRRLHLDGCDRILLFGAFHPLGENKGLRFLLEAAALQPPESRNRITLVVFGQAKPVPLPGLEVRWMGAIRDEDTLADLYSAADVLACPSLQENYPGVVAEALACGRPCVAFRVGGIPDLIEHGRTGWLASPFDVRDLARGLDWALAGRHEFPAGTAARFDVNRMAAAHLLVYSEHLAARAKR